jgi:hypothetical protein
MHKEYNHCRISGSKNLVNFFSFKTALAGGFLKNLEACILEEKYPLTVSFCPESALVQVNEVIDSKLLFENYFYKTGLIDTLSSHFKKMSDEYKSFKNSKKILEIGCNDFSMLKHLVGSQYETIIGVDPSDVAAHSTIDEVHFYNTYFDSNFASRILQKHGQIDVITASNCFAHIEDIQDVTLGISKLLSKNGIAVIEVHWLGNIIKNFQFPFIYHEHMYYFCLRSMEYLMNKFGLEVFDVKKIDIHGGSVRYYIAHKGSKRIKRGVKKLENEEKQLGLYDVNTYVNYSTDVIALGDELKRVISDLQLQGKTVYGYGASGQANTLMAFFNITKNQIPYIIDDSPLKIGCYTPNNHIPIISSEILKTNPPDYILCLAYTFLKEIKKKNRNFKGKWITPLPTIEIS